MKKFIKQLFLLSVLLLFAGSAWALPMAGDTVKMTTAGEYYGMTVSSGDEADTFYNSFCVEKKEFFDPGGIYTVDSVGYVATGGGVNTGSTGTIIDLAGNERVGDPLSVEAELLYGAYFDNILGVTDLAVQNAIWDLEEEDGIAGISTATQNLLDIIASKSYTGEGWNVQIVNIIAYDRNNNVFDKQSQLVGEYAPVPEPATMLLFGIGLLGIAGVGRKKVK